MLTLHRVRLSALTALCATGLAVACSSDGPTQVEGSLLAGLSKTETNDTSTATTPTPSGPGYVHGTVIGQSAPGAGNDSLNTAPRVAGVKVTIYAGNKKVDGVIEPDGPAIATVTTGADGKFTLPTVMHGQYVVTFVPPESAGYYSVYTFGPIHGNSHLYPWWIVLHKK